MGVDGMDHDVDGVGLGSVECFLLKWKSPAE
jgi:hypothetical protein